MAAEWLEKIGNNPSFRPFSSSPLGLAAVTEARIHILCLSSSKTFLSTGITISVGSLVLFFLFSCFFFLFPFSFFLFPHIQKWLCLHHTPLYKYHVHSQYRRDHRALTPSGYLKPLQFLCVDKPLNFQHLEIHLSQFLRFGLSQCWKASQNLLSWNIITICRILPCSPTHKSRQNWHPEATGLQSLQPFVSLPQSWPWNVLAAAIILSLSALALKSLLCSTWRSWSIIYVLISISECLMCKLNDRNKKLHS